MASTYDQLARSPTPRVSRWTHASFVFGKPASRRESIAGVLVSFFELEGREDRAPGPALVPALAKVFVWIVVGVAATSAGVVLLGALAVRIWTGAFG